MNQPAVVVCDMLYNIPRVDIAVVVQRPSRVRLFATPCSAARQASLSLTISQRLPKFMSIESVMPSNTSVALFSSTFSLSLIQGLFQWVGSLHQVAEDWSFSFNINLSNEYSGLISLRIDWFDLLLDK